MHESTLWKIHKSFARPLQHIQHHRHTLTVTMRKCERPQVCERGTKFPPNGCKQKARYDGSHRLEITSSFRSHLYERRGKDKKNKHVALAPLVSSPPRVMIAHKSRAGLVEQNKTRALKGKMELFHSTGIKADDSGMFLLLWRISSIT